MSEKIVKIDFPKPAALQKIGHGEGRGFQRSLIGFFLGQADLGYKQSR
jgi:hypothetical protein